MHEEKKYYLVHKNNLDDFKSLGFPEFGYIDHWRICCHRNYIYLSFDGTTINKNYFMGFMKYTKFSRDWFKRNNWKYMGEYSNSIIRKRKLTKIESNTQL